MLVLTRKKAQLIRIGEDVVIKVIQTGKNSVKIGIDAPMDVRVMRGELDETLSQRYGDPQVAKEEEEPAYAKVDYAPVSACIA